MFPFWLWLPESSELYLLPNHSNEQLSNFTEKLYPKALEYLLSTKRSHGMHGSCYELSQIQFGNRRGLIINTQINA